MSVLYNIEAEHAVLGACLSDPSAVAVAVEFLRSQDFYRRSHQVIFGAIQRVADQGMVVDIATVTEELQNSNEIHAMGGVEYLADLAEGLVTSVGIDHHVNIVRKHGVSRELQQVFLESATALEDRVNPDDVIEQIEFRIQQVNDRQNKADLVPIKNVLLDTFERVEHLFQNKGGLTGVPSGYPDLDKLTSGFQRSDVIILAARPAVGKTAFAMNVVQNVGVRENRPVAVFSLEMAKEQLVSRMLCAEAAVDAGHMRTGFLEEHEWPRLVMAIGVLSEAPIYIDDTPGITIAEIRAKCRRLKERLGDLGMVVIDYLQLIATNKNSGSREQEVSHITRMLKLIARELNVPVVALSQLSRSVEQRADKRPMLSDLRESGAIEQDADIVSFLYRDDYYNPESERRNIVEFIIAKQRSGPTGTVELVFIKNFNKFVSLQRAIPETKPAPEKQPTLFDMGESA